MFKKNRSIDLKQVNVGDTAVQMIEYYKRKNLRYNEHVLHLL